MSDDKFQNKYRIPSARAEWHDYDGGTYFVTICTHGREHHFGEITMDENGESKMILTPIGRFANEQFKNVSNHYPYAEIPLWVIMPNHIHAVVIIRNDDFVKQGVNIASDCRDVARNVSTGGNNEYMSEKSPKRNTLSVVIRGIKSAITKYAHENNIPFAWQSRFHDHIVRNMDELNGISAYIENNVAKWAFDELNDNVETRLIASLHENNE